MAILTRSFPLHSPTLALLPLDSLYLPSTSFSAHFSVSSYTPSPPFTIPSPFLNLPPPSRILDLPSRLFFLPHDIVSTLTLSRICTCTYGHGCNGPYHPCSPRAEDSRSHAVTDTGTDIAQASLPCFQDSLPR
jgi:hypothetical protein